jgi:pimeloyl-ACP methyl ester carboxylesterase
MQNFKDSERFAEMTHGKTRYLEKGSGDTVILIHGVDYTGGATSWYKNIDPLAEHFRVLAIDMLGWGPGDRVERHLAFPYLVGHLREFQDVVGIERCHIVGHSLGGWVGQIFAYESPERVDKLVLVASAGHSAEFVSTAVTNFAVPTREQIYERVAACTDLTKEQIDELAAETVRNIDVPDSAACFRSMVEYMGNQEERRRYITPRLWPRIKTNTLVVSGTDDKGYPPSVGQEMARTIPHARYVEIDAGHQIPFDAPKELNDTLVEFLRS